MIDADLHARYAPVLHFARGERFFPMSVDAFVGQAALWAKGESEPLRDFGSVTPDDLLQAPVGETFLRFVRRGPLSGTEVAQRWGRDTLSLVYRWAQRPYYLWSADAARRIYDWFSPRTSTATRRFWWNPLLWGTDLVRTFSTPASASPRFALPESMRDQAEEAYVDAVGTSLPPSYYYRLVPAAPYLCLQYWFFYPYNDWASSFAGFNDHEGDWESMQFLFARDGGRIVEPPAFVSFVGHHSRITKPWGHPDIATQGTHVHAFVAGGSHATYPQQQDYGILSLLGLVDRASGDGRTVGPDDWAERTDLATVPWLVDYRGSWGTRYWMSLYLLMRMTASGGDPGRGPTHQPGVSAPRGPRFGDVGAEREMWADPVGFARNEPT